MDVIPGAGASAAVFTETVKRLHWDGPPWRSAAPWFRCCDRCTGLGSVVFGTDYPYPHDEISIGGLRALQRTAELDDDERRAVLGGTASRLIPRLVPQPA